MPALEAGTHATTGGAGRGAEGRVLLSTVAFAWMARSSPAMTEGAEFGGKGNLALPQSPPRLRGGWPEGSGGPGGVHSRRTRSPIRRGRYPPRRRGGVGAGVLRVASTDPSVMPALEAGTHATTGGAGRGAEGRVLLSTVAFAWMAGSSPAMTEGSDVGASVVFGEWPATVTGSGSGRGGGGLRGLEARGVRAIVLPRGGDFGKRGPPSCPPSRRAEGRVLSRPSRSRGWPGQARP